MTGLGVTVVVLMLAVIGGLAFVAIRANAKANEASTNSAGFELDAAQQRERAETHKADAQRLRNELAHERRQRNERHEQNAQSGASGGAAAVGAAFDRLSAEADGSGTDDR